MKKVSINEQAIRASIESGVNSMKVSEMRIAAKQHGIKNAKMYKRDVLSSMLVDVIFTETMASVHTSSKSNSKRKSAKGSNTNVESDVHEVQEFLSNCNGDTTRETIFETLMGYGRVVLINVMKSYKVKGWYRIYDKPTMISKLVSKTVDRLAAA